MDIKAHLDAMSDEELLKAGREARDDLTAAATEYPGSERHQECFAGAVIYAGELGKRGLTLATIH